MMPKADTIELDMTVDAALKYIVSMGVVAPADLPRKHGGGARAADAAAPALPSRPKKRPTLRTN